MWAWRSITPRMIARRMFRSIVVGTDGSETARQAVREATALAAALGASIELVCAYEPVAGQRLREEAREAPRDLQWMINAREDVEATLREAAAEVEAAGRGRDDLRPRGRSRPTPSSTSPRSAGRT